MNELIAFAKERLEILSQAEAASSLKGGQNPWSHRKAEVELLLEKMEQIKNAQFATSA
jgi:hypothetical protein